MKVVLGGMWPSDPEERRKAVGEAGVALLPAIMKITFADATDDDYLACKYFISYAAQYPEKIEHFHAIRYIDDDHMDEAFDFVYNEVNAMTEGDLANRVRRHTDAYPMLLGTACALVDVINEELKRQESHAPPLQRHPGED